MTDDAWPKRPDPPAAEEEGEDWQSEKHEAAEAVAVDDTPAPLDDFVEEASAEHAAGEVNVPDGYAVIEGSSRGERRSVAVVVGRFNGEVTNRLLERALEALAEAGVAQEAITVMPVPGAFEIPLASMALAKTRRYACIVTLGCVVRGETPHFDFVAAEAASGIQLAGLETGVPVSFGVLTVESLEQAEARVDRVATQAVESALEMADVFAQLRASAKS